MNQNIFIYPYQNVHPYDALCKKVLSYKLVIAYILQQVVEEFKELSIEDIILNYIHDELSDELISTLIVGDKEVSSGEIRLDLFFSTNDPKKRKGILFDIEAQHSRKLKYKLDDRMQYYSATMLKMQKNVTFTKSHYSNLYKIYSIWIIQKPLKRHRNKIYSYSTKETNYHYQNPNMDLIHNIVINLGGPGKGYQGICRVLDILLSEKKDIDEK